MGAVRFHRWRPYPTQVRLWSNVDMSGGIGSCWPWTGTTNGKYGRLNVDGEMIYAHRYAASLLHGNVDGRVVMHRCDNPICVNPYHLVVGTTEDNIADKLSKNRQSRGERAGGAKLTADVVRSIRAEHAATHDVKAIAAKYGIARTNVHAIVTGKTWRHV